MHYLYRITNQLNGKVYIGQTVDDIHRWSAHKSFAKNPERTGQYIHRAMAKYGIDNFVYEVIATCKTQDDANEVEALLILQYNSRNKDNGYNVMPGGNNISGPEHPNFGKKASEETKLKMSATMKQKCADGWMPVTSFQPGSDATKYWKDKVGHRKGAVLSEETRQKIGEASKGRPSPNKGRHDMFDEETLQKISEANKGQHRSLETEIKSGEHFSIDTEFKKGIIPWNKGKKMIAPGWNKGKPSSRRITLSNDQLEEILKLKIGGKTMAEISDLLGFERHLIARKLKEYISN